jgi:hypothetical protein
MVLLRAIIVRRFIGERKRITVQRGQVRQNRVDESLISPKDKNCNSLTDRQLERTQRGTIRDADEQRRAQVVDAGRPRQAARGDLANGRCPGAGNLRARVRGEGAYRGHAGSSPRCVSVMSLEIVAMTRLMGAPVVAAGRTWMPE